MTTAVQNILSSYEALSEIEKQELAFEILRRSRAFDLPPLSDEELGSHAHELFLKLDKQEEKSRLGKK